jgi:glycine cleavage system H protein
VFAPVSGSVLERNAVLEEHPELVNESPYGDGWLVLVQASDPPTFAELLTAEEYRAFVEGGS